MAASLPATLSRNAQNTGAGSTRGQNSFADVFESIQSSSGGENLAAAKLADSSNHAPMASVPKNGGSKKKDNQPSLPSLLVLGNSAANSASEITPGTLSASELVSSPASQLSNPGQILADTSLLATPLSSLQITTTDAHAVTFSAPAGRNTNSASDQPMPASIQQSASVDQPVASPPLTSTVTTENAALPVPFTQLETVTPTSPTKSESSSDEVAAPADTEAENPGLTTLPTTLHSSQAASPNDATAQDATSALAAASIASTSNRGGAEIPIRAADQTLQLAISASPGATQTPDVPAASFQHSTITPSDPSTPPPSAITLNQPRQAVADLGVAPPTQAAPAAQSQRSPHPVAAVETPVTPPDLAMNAAPAHGINRAAPSPSSPGNATSDSAPRSAIPQFSGPDPLVSYGSLTQPLADVSAPPQINVLKPSQPEHENAPIAPADPVQPQKPASKTADPAARARDGNQTSTTEGLSAAQAVSTPAAVVDMQPAQTFISSAISAGAVHPGCLESPLPANSHAAPLTGAAPEIEVASPAETGSVRIAQMANHIDESQMRVGLTTAEFGNVEILSTVHASNVGLVVGSERGDLHGLLAAEMPLIQRNLEQHNLRLENVHFDRGQQFSSQSGANADSHSQRSWKSGQGNVPTDQPPASEPVLSRNSPPQPALSGLSVLA